MKPRLPIHALTSLWLVWCCALSAHGQVAESTVEHLGFDGTDVSWQVHVAQTDVRGMRHDRHPTILVAGSAAEHISFEVLNTGAVVQFDHPVRAARVIEELSASLWVRSNRPGPILWLRAVLPQQLDPKEGKPVEVYFRGGAYTEKGGRWQELRCTTTQKEVLAQMTLLRGRLGESQINSAGMYVDRVVVTGQLDRGGTEFFFDELKFGPIVSPDNLDGIAQTSTEVATTSPAEFKSGRLVVNGRPMFPRLIPYHSENLDVLQQSGSNVVWIPNAGDSQLLASLSTRGMWATATPPMATSEGGYALDSQTAGLASFSANTNSILAWNLGWEIPANAAESIVSHANQVRAADHALRRPLMIDVTGGEGQVSRDIAMVGVSRSVLHTPYTLQNYSDWLCLHRDRCIPGSFFWTWVSTEADPAMAAWRREADRTPVVVEPEQIRMQVYAAVGSGCRAIGFQKRTPLDGTAVGDDERRLAITLVNLELGLLEPWLATSYGVDRIPVMFADEQPEKKDIIGRLPFGQKAASNKKLEAERGRIIATAVQSRHGLLLMPMWYHPDAQYVPPELTTKELKITVPYEESAMAFEITPTSVRSLPRVRGPGGHEITLSDFDQAAAILLTSNPTLKSDLERRIQLTAPQAGKTSVELATAKLERVRKVDAELQRLGVGRRDAAQVLSTATQSLVKADSALQARNFDAARHYSADVMKLTRFLQHAYWESAIEKQSSATSCPHTVCFQTLPDYWRTVSALGRGPTRTDESLLRSGDFEDPATMIVEKWEHLQNDIDGVRGGADLLPEGRQGEFCLRIWATPEPGIDPPQELAVAPVTICTPPIAVRAGQIVYVSGWVRVVKPITATSTGAMLFDNLIGPTAALHWHDTSEWQPFNMIREVHRSGDFKLNLVLSGLGDVRFDDLRIVAHSPRAMNTAENGVTPAGHEAEQKSGPRRLLDRLPKFRRN